MVGSQDPQPSVEDLPVFGLGVPLKPKRSCHKDSVGVNDRVTGALFASGIAELAKGVAISRAGSGATRRLQGGGLPLFRAGALRARRPAAPMPRTRGRSPPLRTQLIAALTSNGWSCCEHSACCFATGMSQISGRSSTFTPATT